MADLHPSVNEREDAIEFIVTLGRALHVHGAPAPAVEQAMERAATRLGLQGQFFATPTSIFASFPENPERPYASARTLLLRVEPGSPNLSSRARLEEIVLQSELGTLSPALAREQLAAIEHEPAPFSRSLTLLAFVLSSASAAVFFGGNLHETCMGGLIGLIVGLCYLGAQFSTRLSRVLLPTAAFLGAAAASVIDGIWGARPEISVIVAGLITLLPGLTLTTSISEVAVGHLASGTARLMGGIMTLLALLFGAALGGRVGTLLSAEAANPQLPLAIELPSYSLYLALLIAPLCFGVLFQAPRRDMGWIMLASILGYFGSLAGRELIGEHFSEALGGFVVCIVSNAYSRWSLRPPAIPLVPGLLLLVPGGIGFRSLFTMLEKDVVSGVDTAFRVALVGISIAAGLLVANVVLPARRSSDATRPGP
jgi:uncharacterized membrane protein YjjP (DUF1212 family)